MGRRVKALRRAWTQWVLPKEEVVEVVMVKVEADAEKEDTH